MNTKKKQQKSITKGGSPWPFLILMFTILILGMTMEYFSKIN